VSTADQQAIRETVLRVLRTIAPEVDPASIDPKVDWRDQLDLDSVDLLNFLVRVHEALGVDIPEEDYPKLSSLERCVAYLAPRAGKG
jgi:acyl carrier protein